MSSTWLELFLNFMLFMVVYGIGYAIGWFYRGIARPEPLNIGYLRVMPSDNRYEPILLLDLDQNINDLQTKKKVVMTIIDESSAKKTEHIMK